MKLSPEQSRAVLRVVEWIRESEAVQRATLLPKKADARDLSNARKALARAIKHCRRPSVQLALRRRPQRSMYAVSRAISEMESLLKLFDAPVRTTVKGSDPRWHQYVPRLRALYRLLMRKPATLYYKGSQASLAAKFVASVLAEAGVRAGIRGVCAYPRTPRDK